MQVRKTQTDRSPLLISIVLCAALFLGVVPRSYAANGELENRYIKLSGREVSAVVTHAIGLQMSNLTVPVGSIAIEYCSNSPLIGEPCTVPAGLSLAGVALNTQTGDGGFTIFSKTPNKIILQRPAALPLGQASEYVFANTVNPSNAGSQYVRLTTYTSTDGTGLPIEAGGVVYVIGSGLQIDLEVPPYLIFCAAINIQLGDCTSANSYFIDFGELSASQSATGKSEFMVATNAADGFSIIINGTTLTSGNNIIDPLTSGGLSIVGTNQFGLNLRSNSNPAVGAQPTAGTGAPASGYDSPNIFKFQNGDVVAQSSRTTDYQKFTASYVTNISSGQPAGYYATTLTYICLANF